MSREQVLKVIGANVRAERARRHLTQEALAELAGIGVAQLARMERGDVDAGVTKYVDLAWALEVDPHAFFVGAEAATGRH